MQPDSPSGAEPVRLADLARHDQEGRRTPGTLVVVTADHETGGLTIPSGNADFTRAESGIDYRFSTKGHTGTLVPVYLYGAGADAIRGVMDNTELARRIMELLGLE